MAESTPMMRQYLDIKSKHKDAILFFRMGDFYEMFFEDAKIASKVLEITLTSRNKEKDKSVPMCGVPCHASESYIARLINAGYKVAICEQIEDPKKAKGIVKRNVIRIVTPGTILNSPLVGSKENQYLASFVFCEEKVIGFAITDISTGEFFITELDGTSPFQKLKDELSRWNPRELLIPNNISDNEEISDYIKTLDISINPYDDWVFSYDHAYRLFLDYFKVNSLDGYGCESRRVAVQAGGAILQYLQETQKTSLAHINKLTYYNTENYMIIDPSTQRNLELLKSLGDESKKGSLLDILDLTITPMGGRKIKKWILRPLLNASEIRKRQDVVDEFLSNTILRGEVREALKEVYDLERLAGRISLSAANARDLSALKKSVLVLPRLNELINQSSSPLLNDLLSKWDNLQDIGELIERSIQENPPYSINEGGMIKEGFNSKLDELRKITKAGKDWISNFEAQEKKKTGINSLRVGYNKVFGYYIEVTKKNIPLIPPDYIRKQTLVNAERYITPELKEYEIKVLNAQEEICVLEYNIFQEIRESIIKEVNRIQKIAGIISTIDVLASFAEASSLYNYVKPKINENDVIHIAEGRHPVLEQIDVNNKFVPNDALIDCENNQILIITGPNMAGKSTYLRQVALIVLMAQTGSFVPAKQAEIGMVDRIFTRVGAQDFLTRGQSTFMVEMNEAANILNNATKKSLIILDEIGRGTSTFDGISIAWSIVEYIHDKLEAKTLFATHYHELADLSLVLKKIRNYNFAVKEWNNEIIFLRRIVPGSTDRSYGIQVARLAGIPKEILERAKEVLCNLENTELDNKGKPKISYKKRGNQEEMGEQFSLFAKRVDVLMEEIKRIDINNTTPMEAIKILHKISLLAKDK
ncbi:MAG TPA: DNA mismatch repair protein MutS [Nitrospinota bacterium]|nr:DNA mismatch repair protein MutS [Nitrospinota bacterium]